MNHEPTGKPPLTPTLLTIEELFWKAERELYRTWHARNAHHRADHLYNFCITAHALRDYYLKQAPEAPFTKKQCTGLHQEWSDVEVIRAVSEIANSAKHWKLYRPPRTGGMELDESVAVDLYLSPEDEIIHNAVQIPDWIIELESGHGYETWCFLNNVLNYWRDFLKSNGCAVGRQPVQVW